MRAFCLLLTATLAAAASPALACSDKPQHESMSAYSCVDPGDARARQVADFAAHHTDSTLAQVVSAWHKTAGASDWRVEFTTLSGGTWRATVIDAPGGGLTIASLRTVST